jgi:cell volume regulation protein A
VAYTVHAQSPVARGQHLPRWARPALVLRGGREIELPATQKLEPGDHLYLFAAPDKVPLLDKLFAGQVELSPEDREVFGDVALPAATPLERLSAEYGLDVPIERRAHTLAEEFHQIYGAVEVGDRLRLAGVELVVTDEEGGDARQVGLVLDPPQPRRPFPFLPSGAEFRAWLKRRLQRRKEKPPEPAP